MLVSRTDMLIYSLRRIHYLSEQSCGLGQANHRKQMPINPTGLCTIYSFIVLLGICLQMPVFHLGSNICFDQKMVKVRCIHLHFREKVMCLEKYQRTNMKMKSSPAVIPTMKCILKDMFGQQTMDYYYKPKLRHVFQRSMWGVFNLKVMFQAFEQLC